MSSATALALRTAGHDQPPALASGVEAVTSAIEQLKSLRTFVNNELIRKVDYGTIPGTGDKPTLLLPGAQKVALYFNTTSQFENTRTELGNGHMEVLSCCRLVSRSSGNVVAEGYGSCSSMESKYRWRKGERTCPDCGASAIIKGKAEYGGGWICFGKKGGCGAKFSDGNPTIEGHAVGRVENPDIWDARNTVLKIGMKRSLVAAALALGAMAEMFTQDLDDFYDLGAAQPRQDPPQEDPQDARRREVNEMFKAPPKATEGRRTPDRGNGQRQPARQPEPAAETFAVYAARTLREAQDAWHNEQAVTLAIPEASRSELDTNIHRLKNALATKAIDTEKPDGSGPMVVEEAILNAKGNRDRKLVSDCCEWLWNEWPAWVKETVVSYLDGKAKAALEAAKAPREPGQEG